MQGKTAFTLQKSEHLDLKKHFWLIIHTEAMEYLSEHVIGMAIPIFGDLAYEHISVG